MKKVLLVISSIALLFASGCATKEARKDEMANLVSDRISRLEAPTECRRGEAATRPSPNRRRCRKPIGRRSMKRRPMSKNAMDMANKAEAEAMRAGGDASKAEASAKKAEEAAREAESRGKDRENVQAGTEEVGSKARGVGGPGRTVFSVQLVAEVEPQGIISMGVPYPHNRKCHERAFPDNWTMLKCVVHGIAGGPDVMSNAGFSCAPSLLREGTVIGSQTGPPGQGRRNRSRRSPSDSTSASGASPRRTRVPILLSATRV